MRARTIVAGGALAVAAAVGTATIASAQSGTSSTPTPQPSDSVGVSAQDAAPIGAPLDGINLGPVPAGFSLNGPVQTFPGSATRGTVVLQRFTSSDPSIRTLIVQVFEGVPPQGDPTSASAVRTTTPLGVAATTVTTAGNGDHVSNTSVGVAGDRLVLITAGGSDATKAQAITTALAAALTGS